MEMEDQYGSISDLRQFISRASVTHQFPSYPQQPSQLPSSSDIFSPHQHHHQRGLSSPTAQPHAQPYEMVVLGRPMSSAGHGASIDNILHHNSAGFHNKDHLNHNFNSESTTTTANIDSGGFDAADAGAARWPRQETLTLLEIRSKLDHKFKEANQKGPLWDELARIMSEEHGYQRTGKKCREKFENLYKYYKKTKEGKAGRQDGKHYRFFRQLEALYGERHHNHTHSHNQNHPIASDTHQNVPSFHNNHLSVPTNLGTSNNHCPNSSLSLSNSSDDDHDTSSSENDAVGSIETHESKKKKRGKRSWKAKIKEFIDHQMRKIMEKQEAWLDKMMKTLENREKERILREEEWRKQETERMEREHKFWASERAWIEARDSALMNALEKITSSKEKDHHHRHHHNHHDHNQWLETEVTRLIQLRTSMESRFQQCGFSEEVLWDDIAAKMAYLGYSRSASACKEKWDNINKFFQGKDNINLIIRDNDHIEGNKKRKENYGEGGS
ncbi:trihelix transcription factor PTL isoform X2 [Amaranthus tricolor]|uniref:trihelix transcription factor PTL isoform X2 n=1 Tax=Amaranthus tricolor TaxID=29722 RepID=UPI00258A608B|nr:trihelix transcription factor PTL isoform X2 [Amaranthus tricolor]